ncbi:hypothetical protein C4D60_Mb06t31580 [Musa balbisiana]|uniref:Uncharacterized protein n=1 Tax=Musa balbisiana TaxID=52838 RepID=A0A4S8IS27_MUSBA|nr:hypothetical protein C4D60_Mb06t31580 [Musa balbisiana]
MDGSLSGATVAKRLASCNRTARDRAVRALSSWLCHQPSSPKSGRASSTACGTPTISPSRLNLAGRLAALLESVPSPLAARYFASFLLTIRREWGGIAFLRLDKLYLLIRKFLRYAFLLERMGCGAVSPANRYHVAEVFLDEMREFLALAVETLELMLKPFISVLEKSAVKLLDSASASETLRGDRKILFGLRDDFLWLENDLEKSRVHISTEKLENGSSENVISTVVSESTEQVEKSAVKLLDSASASETLRGDHKILFGLRDDFLWLENDLEKSRVHISTEKLENGSSENVISTVVSESTEQVEPFKSLDPAHSRSNLLESYPTRNFP